jgi:hypothetical protein
LLNFAAFTGNGYVIDSRRDRKQTVLILLKMRINLRLTGKLSFSEEMRSMNSRMKTAPAVLAVQLNVKTTSVVSVKV